MSEQETDPLLVAYEEVAGRIEGLVLSPAAPDGAADLVVPACPEWTVDQLVRHLVGIADDWARGRLDDYGSDRWTEAQIARWADEPLADVLARWPSRQREVAALEPHPAMGSAGTWLFGDACVHEADLRPVLAPGTRPATGHVGLATKAGVSRWRAHASEHGLPPLTVEAPSVREWQIGEADPDGPRVVVDGYELFRALYGRRSRRQVEQWDWSVDPSAWLDGGLPYPFDWARADVVEPASPGS